MQKAKSLTEAEALEVLVYIARLPRQCRWTAQELMLLPLEERNRILEAQMTQAAELYRNDPDLVMEIVDEPLDYE